MKLTLPRSNQPALDISSPEPKPLSREWLKWLAEITSQIEQMSERIDELEERIEALEP